MRVAVCLVTLSLVGCAGPKHFTSLCDIPDLRTASGSYVTFSAILVPGGMEYPQMAMDPRCWRGIAAATQDAPNALMAAFSSPGRFNKFAVVAARIEQDKFRPWLHITAALQVRVNRPMSDAQEHAFFNRMQKVADAWNASHRQERPAR